MRFRLATWFSATIAGILTLSVISSLVALYAAWRVGQRLEQAHQEELPSVRAEEVEILLLERNSLVAAQLLDKDNPVWTKNLAQSQGQFQEWIAKVRSSPAVPMDEEDLLQRLEIKWADLDAAQQKAIELHATGNTDKAKTLLLTEIRQHLSKDAYNLCEQLIASNDRYVKQVITRAEGRIRVTTWVVALSVCLTLGLGGTLLWMFLYRVLRPLRGMVADARLFRGNDDAGTDEDELRSMGSYFRELMSDVTDTRSRLERSRMRLAAAEKLAAVGKLAATVAHEIRNPLTAMKMWLYDIQGKVEGDAELEGELGIISEEITRLEGIVRNFLEFSRPMELHCRPIEVDCVVQQTLNLVEQRLKQRGIRVARATTGTLPTVPADADKLKQVFLNLVGNALDAIADGGEICIGTGVDKDAEGREMVVVRFRDSGSGMSKEVQARIFDPFFTTKENGTGLGLCIAAQVMARHKGSLVLESSTESGTTFAVWLPVLKESPHG
jgi:signal transduction histidine kinase